jgi:hypothetical protein
VIAELTVYCDDEALAAVETAFDEEARSPAGSDTAAGERPLGGRPSRLGALDPDTP